MGSGASRGGRKPILYHSPISGPCRAVLLAANMAKIDLELKHIDLLKGEQKEESFLRINPEHTVPTLVDNELTLLESRAILTYLVDKYAPGHSIYPKSHEVRARINRLLFHDLCLVSAKIGEFMFPQMMQRQPPDADKQLEVERVFDNLEGLLKEEFFVGNSVTLADISILASLSVLEANDWKFERWTKVNEWRNRMKQLQPYEETFKPWGEFLQTMRSNHQEQE